MFFFRAHEGQNAWWRWLLVIGGTVVVWLLGHIPAVIFMEAETKRLGLNDQAFIQGGVPAGVDRNLFLLISLLPFALAFIALWLLVRLLHRRPFLSVITGRPRFAWRRALIAFAIWLGIGVVGAFAFMPPSSYSYQLTPSLFLPLVLIALFLLPLQTTFEEVFFRGYLMQGISLLSNNKIVPLIVITALFVVIHIPNPEFSGDYWKGALSYLSLSTLFGLAAILDDGLEVPCGLHAANNFFLVAILSPTDGSFTTYSVFTTQLAALMALSPWLDIALAIAGFAVLAYVFGWRLSRLSEPTTPPAEIEPAQA